MTERIEELINKEIDGVLTPREVAELRKHLEKNAAAAKLNQELHALARRLAEIPQVDPPAHLKKHILNKV